MESRIPKHTSRSKITENLPGRMKEYVPVNQGIRTITTNIPNTNPHLLRRRSRSVGDLRAGRTNPPVSRRPAQPRIDDNGIPNRGATQKRPAPPTDGPSRPKLTKKIPDWDYKSRFLDLNLKFTKSQEDLRAANSKLSNMIKMEEDFLTQRSENDALKEQIKVLRDERIILQNERDHYCTEYKRLEQEVLSLRNANEQLSKDFEEQAASVEILQNSLSITKKDLSTCRKKCSELTSTLEQTTHQLGALEILRRKQHNLIQDLKGNIRVFCRVRPPILNEAEERPLCSFGYLDENTLEITKARESLRVVNGKPIDLKQEFNFDKVFPPLTTQDDIFNDLSEFVQSALDGYNVCVFAYGQTGAGKTHTMQGSTADPGMIPRTITFIFDKIEAMKDSNWKYQISASFLEIYNETIKDLLQPELAQTCDIKFNEGRGVTVSNLKIETIKSAQHLLELMQVAQRNRAVAATNFNLHSSRSHAVTKIHLKAISLKDNTTYKGSLNLVDLAGSESAKTSSDDRLVETKNINRSLSTLGSVMLALHNKDKHVPYRNSKLTFLLQSCLGGNSKTLMFVNVSPFEECYTENINSLRFASKIKEIKIKTKRNKCFTVSA